MAEKIYIITTGEYSDYSIERVFSTRKKAMEYLDTKDNEYRLEVYDIDEPIKREKQMYCISFNLDKKKVHGVRTCDPKYANMIHAAVVKYSLTTDFSTNSFSFSMLMI